MRIAKSVSALDHAKGNHFEPKATDATLNISVGDLFAQECQQACRMAEFFETLKASLQACRLSGMNAHWIKIQKYILTEVQKLFNAACLMD